MGQPIEITRLEFSASDLRKVAAKTEEGGWVRRLLAIALLLDDTRARLRLRRTA